MAISFLVRAGIRLLGGHVARSLDDAQAAVDRGDAAGVTRQVRRLRELLQSLRTTVDPVVSGRVASVTQVVHSGVDAMLNSVEVSVAAGDFATASQWIRHVRTSLDTLLKLLED